MGGTDKPIEIIWNSKIRIVFILCLGLRFLIEIGFFYLLYIIQMYQTKKKGVSNIQIFDAKNLFYAKKLF